MITEIQDYIARCDLLGVEPVIDGVVIKYDETYDAYTATGFDDSTFGLGIKDSRFIFTPICKYYQPESGEEIHLAMLLQEHKVYEIDFNNVSNMTFSLYYPFEFHDINKVYANNWENLYLFNGAMYVTELSVNGINSLANSKVSLHMYKSLEKLWMSGVTQLHRAAFMNCHHLEYLYLDSLKSVENNVFYGLQNLKYLYAPCLKDGIIGFSDCYKLQYVNLNSYDSDVIDTRAIFRELAELREVHMRGLRRVPTNCFLKCASLKILDIPNVEVLGKRCFVGCSSLEELYLPKLKVLDKGCFYDCDRLKRITINKETEIKGKLRPDIEILREG